MRDRSLGVIIYPDGSQAEVWLCKVDAPIWETWTEIVRLKCSRRLTLAPFGLISLLCLIAFSLSSCVSLPIKGDKPICLMDMKSGVRACEYDTWQACHADMQDYQQCYHR